MKTPSPCKSWCRSCLYKGKNCPNSGVPSDDVWGCWCGSCANDGTGEACYICGSTVIYEEPPLHWKKKKRHV